MASRTLLIDLENLVVEADLLLYKWLLLPLYSSQRYTSATYARKLRTTFNMLTTSLLFAALAATGLAQAPAGYRTVYITSNVDAKFVVVAKARTAGSSSVVCVLTLTEVTG